jgi:hypothetical protein
MEQRQLVRADQRGGRRTRLIAAAGVGAVQGIIYCAILTMHSDQRWPFQGLQLMFNCSVILLFLPWIALLNWHGMREETFLRWFLGACILLAATMIGENLRHSDQDLTDVYSNYLPVTFIELVAGQSAVRAWDLSAAEPTRYSETLLQCLYRYFSGTALAMFWSVMVGFGGLPFLALFLMTFGNHAARVQAGILFGLVLATFQTISLYMCAERDPATWLAPRHAIWSRYLYFPATLIACACTGMAIHTGSPYAFCAELGAFAILAFVSFFATSITPLYKRESLVIAVALAAATILAVLGLAGIGARMAEYGLSVRRTYALGLSLVICGWACGSLYSLVHPADFARRLALCRTASVMAAIALYCGFHLAPLDPVRLTVYDQMFRLANGLLSRFNFNFLASDCAAYGVAAVTDMAGSPGPATAQAAKGGLDVRHTILEQGQQYLRDHSEGASP